MKFTKMHGCGNDFIVFDEHDGHAPVDAVRARALCDRRTGIGADGVLVIGSLKGSRWPLSIHNADGSIADACGNGSRCVARYLLERYGGDALELDTKSGLVRAWRDADGYTVELDAPQLGSALRIAVGDREYEARAVRVGNPNVVVFVDDPSALDLEALALASTAIAGPANVAAVHGRGPAEITLRVHERGAGETLACGTGACAAVAAAMARGDVTSDTVRVRLPGGTLVVRARGAHFELSGPADYVFQGEV